ncbi:MAG: DUF1684 domain-containing protein [Anaerolineales bacterium]|nr:DUF1684 domain-containing protein [Anaerolineales bacterium]
MNPLQIFRAQKDGFFESDEHSPLTAEQKQNFAGLKYFEENPTLRLEVDLEPFDPVEQVNILTNTGDVQAYERTGYFQFMVEGELAKLTVFRNEHGYFLPFADSLAGEETYGAGRYLEPEDASEGRLFVDFNLAYNPYCAYNESWSCPITPAENRLKLPIRAGEKVFK